jgi:DNA-directed RNA polymerase specialized sigma24 family protein
VKGMKAAEVMMVFDIQSKRTAHAIVKRGYHIVDYMESRQCPGTMEDVEEAYRIAKWWFYRKLGGRVPHGLDADDMIQEAVTRLVELAGDPRMQEASYRFYVVRSTMAEYLRSNQKHAHGDEEEIEAPGSRRGNWDRNCRATETMCRVIEARGLTPMSRAA